MPSVSEIDELMKRWSREWVPETSVDCQGEVFNVLWEASERYYGSNHYGIRPNYERVLGEMTSLASWLSPRPFGNPIIEAIRGGSPKCSTLLPVDDALRKVQRSAQDCPTCRTSRLLRILEHT